MRRRWYAVPGRQHRLARPVISVGNISFGGRGKTPLVALVAKLLVEAGHRPAILTRGYARAIVEDGVVVVSDGVHVLADLDRSGDEPLQLARDVPGACVLVCEQRALAGALAERSLGATVHILDDGFQHLQLARDLDLVVVTPADLADRPAPFGRLREPVDALARADAVLCELSANVSTCDLPEQVHARRFLMRRALEAPEPLECDRPWAAPDRRVVAVAGIAQPERFSHSLAEAGWTVVERVDFPDHHRYTASDLARMASVASRTGAPIVTTAKDAMRLMPFRPLPCAVARVPLTLTIDPFDQFAALLLERATGRA